MKASIIILGIFFYNVTSAQQTNISGIINNYVKVTAVSTTQGKSSIGVVSSNGFVVGNTVLIIQMKGATIDTSNSSNFGTILNYNNAGNYEFSIIDSVNANVIALRDSLRRAYDPAGVVQLIRVPYYNDVRINGTLTAQSWNGTTGGVLVFEACGSVTLDANIDVSGLGFRGGDASNNYYNIGCAFWDYYDTAASINSAKKGEGIVEYHWSYTSGRGALANGGGGGNNTNSGGAGGGNSTAGGRGGNQYEGCSSSPLGGDGGRALQYSNSLNKIFLGGGGGGGHQNESLGSPGTNAGGLIIIRASTLIGNGHTIVSNGLDHFTINGRDGQGGGGAGGTILFDVTSFTPPLTIQASGGKGGSLNYETCHGPGGGGSGGVVWISSSTLPNGITTNLNGGMPGVDVNSLAQCHNGPHGAAKGNDGNLLNNLYIPGNKSVCSLCDLLSVSSSSSFEPTTGKCCADFTLSNFYQPDIVWSIKAKVLTKNVKVNSARGPWMPGPSYNDSVIVWSIPTPGLQYGKRDSLSACFSRTDSASDSQATLLFTWFDAAGRAICSDTVVVCSSTVGVDNATVCPVPQLVNNFTPGTSSEVLITIKNSDKVKNAWMISVSMKYDADLLDISSDPTSAFGDVLYVDNNNGVLNFTVRLTKPLATPDATIAHIPVTALLSTRCNGTLEITTSTIHLQNNTITSSGCSTTFSVDEDCVTPHQLRKHSGAMITALYPMPAHDDFTAEIHTMNDSPVHIYVVDIFGRVVSSEEHFFVQGNHSLKLSTQQYAEGIYVLAVSSGASYETRTFGVIH